MKKIFVLCTFLFLTGAFSLAAQVNKKNTPTGEIYTLEGVVKSRFGVYAVITISNWEELEEFPLEKEEGYIYLFKDKGVPANITPGWIKICKATVQTASKEKKQVELKIMEDLPIILDQMGLGDLKLVPGNVMQFRWEVKEFTE